MIGADELRVAQNYSQFSIPQKNFYGMSALQRERALKRFNEAKVIIEDIPQRENTNAVPSS